MELIPRLRVEEPCEPNGLQNGLLSAPVEVLVRLDTRRVRAAPQTCPRACKPLLVPPSPRNQINNR
eukprot:9579872-Lingulodinium_polyedra.AAC.1